MVKEKKGIIVLDNDVKVLPIFNYFCPKCKKNLSPGKTCYQCSAYPYECVINLGYYRSGWFYLSDKYISADIKNTYDLNFINPKYRFSKLINDAKRRWDRNTISDKKTIINILCKGLAWKMINYEDEFLNKIDIIVHIPKKDENPERDEIEMRLFNHGYYYAHYTSIELDIPFDDKLIFEYEHSRKGNRKFGISNKFKVKKKTILIVDDTYTRGDTKGPISNDLKEAGASQVYLGVIGRSIA